MPDPISNQCPPPRYDLDAALHNTDLGRRDDVGLNEELIEPHTPTVSEFFGVSRLKGMMEAITGGGVTVIGGVLAEQIGLIEHADELGDYQNKVYHQERMRGGVAFIAGYGDSPESLAHAAESPGFRDGLVAADKLGRSISEQDLADLVNYIRPRAKDGESAVLNGLDEGLIFEAHYENDASFRAGVDHMRYVQEHDPAAFNVAKRTSEDDRRLIDCGTVGLLRS